MQNVKSYGIFYLIYVKTKQLITGRETLCHFSLLRSIRSGRSTVTATARAPPMISTAVPAAFPAPAESRKRGTKRNTTVKSMHSFPQTPLAYSQVSLLFIASFTWYPAFISG